MPNPVSYFELGGKNAAALSELYTELFDWTIEPMGQSAAGTDFHFVHQEEGGIVGGIMGTTEGMPDNYHMFYVSVDDIQAYLDKAESLGCSTVVPAMSLPNGNGAIGVFQDPQGNFIGLHKF